MHWQIDLERSSVAFSARSFNYMVVDGRFQSFRGTFHLDEGDLSQSWVEVEIDAASVVTNNPKRDEHICSDHFLDIERFPTFGFRSTAIDAARPTRGVLIGDLTLHGVTRPLRLAVESTPAHRGDTASYTATATIDRREWDMPWNDVPGMVSFKIDISLHLVAVRQFEPANLIS